MTLGGNGDIATQVGMAVHVYAANTSMTERVFYNADGEMLIVPQQGRGRFVTELGIIEAACGEIVIMPRGLRFRVELPDGPSRGYICENYGPMLRLPDSVPSAPTGWPIRATSSRRLRRTRTLQDRSSWSPNSRAISGRPAWSIRRSTSSPGTAISCSTNTIWPGST